jgi:hypothetical protein
MRDAVVVPALPKTRSGMPIIVMVGLFYPISRSLVPVVPALPKTRSGIPIIVMVTVGLFSVLVGLFYRITRSLLPYHIIVGLVYR